MYKSLRIFGTVARRIIPKQLRKEEFIYYSDLRVEALKSDIQELFHNPKRWDFSVNLAGKFISDDEFEITPKWQFTLITGAESMISYLNGRLYQDEFQRTKIQFSVRPNPIFPLFFFGFPMIGLLFLLADNMPDKSDDTLFGTLMLVGVVPSVMFISGYRAKQGIKKEFIKTFNLKQMV